MNNFIAITILCVVVLSRGSCWAAPPAKEIATGPLNTAVVLTETKTVLLQCCVTPETVSIARPQWWEYATKTVGNQISDGNITLVYHPNYLRYRLQVTPDFVCYNLNITGLTTADGTRYMCVDNNADLPQTIQLGAQLVVIDSDPTCDTALTDGVDAVEGTYYVIECIVNFGAQSPVAPVMTWTGPPPFTAINITSSISVQSEASFIANRTMDGQVFTMTARFTSTGFGGNGMATNIPPWNYTWTSLPLHVTWAPTNIAISPTVPAVDIGTVLTCSCDAKPSASFSWLAVAGNVSGRTWDGPTLQTTMDMAGLNTLRCRARNLINGLNQTNDGFFDVTVNPINACLSEPCQFGGTCIQNGNDYICDCLPGFTGRNCETQIDYCESLPCQNGGTCVKNINSYVCICRSTFTGTHCETPL